MVKNQLYTFQVKFDCDNLKQAEDIDNKVSLHQHTDCIRTGVSVNNNFYEVGFNKLTKDTAISLLTKLSSIGKFTIVEFRETY